MRPTDMYEIPERVAARRHGLPVYGWRRHEVGLPRRGVTFPTSPFSSRELCRQFQSTLAPVRGVAHSTISRKSLCLPNPVNCLNLYIFTYSYFFNRIEIGSKLNLIISSPPAPGRKRAAPSRSSAWSRASPKSQPSTMPVSACHPPHRVPPRNRGTAWRKARSCCGTS